MKQPSLRYAGIGARNTPEDILDVMENIAIALAEDTDYILRTGGADGADDAFLAGAESVGENKFELYLPWREYNDHLGGHWTLKEEHYRHAWLAHPNWDACSTGARKLHARNAKIVHGASAQVPVDFVVCWTENGAIKGGTGTAITMADTALIPVFNLGSNLDHAMNDLCDFVNLDLEW